jgi:7-carboxy-7-deazaguanine synthase
MSNPEKKIPVVEIFGPTVQGEGATIGQPTYFIRFGLCDYKCRMCDSMHAVDPAEVKARAQWLTQLQIADVVTEFAGKHPRSTNWITFSGGNPCIHDLSELVTLLSERGWEIAVETQGTFAPNWLHGCSVVTCSPKGPGMGEKCDLEVLDEFVQALEHHPGLNLKMVLFDQRDLEFAAMIKERYTQRGIAPSQFYLSLGNPFPPGMEPHVGADNNKRPISHRLLDRYRVLLPDVLNHPVLSAVKFLPQWHVILWDNTMGV